MSHAWQLVIDAQGVQGPFNERGIARTVTSLAAALVEIGAPVSAVLINPMQPPPPSWHRSLRDLPLRWATWDVGADIAAGPPAVWLMLSPMEGSSPDQAIVPAFVADGGAAIVPLLYDAIPFTDVLRYQRRHADARMHHARLPVLRQAAHTLSISAYSAEQWSELVAPLAAWSVVGCAAPDRYQPPTTATRAAIAGIDRSYALYVGGTDARKNVDGAIDAYARLPEPTKRRHQLVVVGSARPDQFERWRSRAAAAGVRGDIVFTGMLDDDRLVQLAQHARVAFFPSLAEGFGMPVAEAIACGTPAICSNTTAMPEIIGWPPALFDPTDPDDMARVLAAALDDDTYRADLINACNAARPNLTWTAVARRTLDALEQHVVPDLTPNRPPRRAVAVIGTDSTNRTELVDSFLSRGVDVDVFGDGRASATAAHYPIEAFGRSVDPAHYEHRVYVLNDTAASGAAFQVAQRFPGVVILDSERLTTAACAAADREIASLLRATYTALPPAIEQASTPTLTALIDHDIALIAPVGRVAHRIITFTDSAANAARLDIGPWHRCPPIDTVADTDAIVALLGLSHV